MHRKCNFHSKPSLIKPLRLASKYFYNTGILPQRSHTDFEMCRWDQVGKARGVNRPSPRPSPQPSPRPDFGYYPQQNPHEQPAYPPNPHYGQPTPWQPDLQAPPAAQYPPQGVYPPQPPIYGYDQAPPYGYDPNAPPPQAYGYGGPPAPPGQYYGGY